MCPERRWSKSFCVDIRFSFVNLMSVSSVLTCYSSLMNVL